MMICRNKAIVQKSVVHSLRNGWSRKQFIVHDIQEVQQAGTANYDFPLIIENPADNDSSFFMVGSRASPSCDRISG
jgi:hypothetical protein